jgi:predicted 3-demethylubiquinone-9 3-methyltransferase (glyoxalase superfamily)
MPKITPNLWFDDNGLEAAEWYVSIFPNSQVNEVTYYPEAAGDQAGTVLTVNFSLDGQPYTILNGGPQFTFDEAISFLIDCKDQDEVDFYWEKLVEGGGEHSQCGWLKDRYGLSWQVVPAGWEEMFTDPDPDRVARAFAAMMQMSKLDKAALEAAADGRQPAE